MNHNEGPELRLGPTLLRLMLARGLSLREVSRLSGVAPSTLFEWRARRHPRDPAQLARVARVFGVSLHFLLFGEADPFANSNSFQSPEVELGRPHPCELSSLERVFGPLPRHTNS